MNPPPIFRESILIRQQFSANPPQEHKAEIITGEMADQKIALRIVAKKRGCRSQGR